MPYVSLITPVHDGARFIDASLREILRTLEQLDQPFEVLVVCDGCGDDTEAVACAVGDPRVRVLSYAQNHGKGYALCYGIHHARGRLVGWLDADLDIHPQAIVEAARELDRGTADAILGSKRHPGSVVDYPWERRLLSWGFHRLVRLLLRVDARDTQVGAKLFRREMLDTVAPLLLIKAYAFDLEMLAVGAEFGFDRVTEIPITLDYRFSGSGINRHAVRMMFQDTLAIAYRIRLRHWYVRQYARLQRARMDALTASGAEVGSGLQLPSAPSGTLEQIRRHMAMPWPPELPVLPNPALTQSSTMSGEDPPAGYRSSHISAVPGTVVLPPEIATSTPRRLWSIAADVATLPLVALGPHEPVELAGRRFALHRQFARWAWRTERCVELALGKSALAAHGPDRSLEVGNVMPLAGVSGHTVVDKYEVGDRVVNEDIVDYAPGRRYRLVVSLSTLEHVGWDEVPRDPAKAVLALERMSVLVDDDGALLVTIPVGVRRDLESAFVTAAGSTFDSVTLLVRRSRRPRWEARPLSELPGVLYGRPFPCGNGVLVGMRGNPFGASHALLAARDQ